MIRRRLNPRALSTMASAPGTDPRTWVAIARIDEDPDAIRWREEEDGPVGWVVDVTITGGPLDQEGPLPCRLGSGFAADVGLRSDPPTPGGLVVVLIPGNPNEECTIIAALPCEGQAPPSEVNGESLTEEYAMANHVLVTPHGVDEQIGGDRRIKTGGTHMLLGPLVELADEDAGASFVRGEDLESAVNALADALQQLATAVGTGLSAITPAGGGPGIGNTFALALTQFSTAIAQFKGASSSWKSARIKGE